MELSFAPVPEVTDIVMGDPVFYVPIKLSEFSDLEGLVGLCFQIHGENNSYYNLISTDCVSVNGLWTAVTKTLNVITEVGVTFSAQGMCHTLLIDLDWCSITVDEDSVITKDGNYRFKDYLVVKRIEDSMVSIHIPHCDRTIEFLIQCETGRVFDPDTGMHKEYRMLKFSMTRRLLSTMKPPPIQRQLSQLPPHVHTEPHGLFGNSAINT